MRFKTLQRSFEVFQYIKSAPDEFGLSTSMIGIVNDSWEGENNLTCQYCKTTSLINSLVLQGQNMSVREVSGGQNLEFVVDSRHKNFIPFATEFYSNKRRLNILYTASSQEMGKVEDSVPEEQKTLELRITISGSIGSHIFQNLCYFYAERVINLEVLSKSDPKNGTESVEFKSKETKEEEE